MKWTATDTGWLCSITDEKPLVETGCLWFDHYLSLYAELDSPIIHYEIVLDKRRKVYVLANDTWVALFFTTGKLRRNLKGRILWADKNISLTQFGNKPRSYVLVSKGKL